MTHKFFVGQAVDFNRKLRRMSGGPYEVVSVPPVDDADSPTYRVKSKTEPFARVAREADLVAVDLGPPSAHAPTPWAGPMSGRRASPPPLRSR